MSASRTPVPSGGRRWAACFDSKDHNVYPISYLRSRDTPEAIGQSLRRFYLSNLPAGARLRARLGLDSPVVETAQILPVLVSSPLPLTLGLERPLTASIFYLG
jgi:hypothetical protein